MPSLRDVCRWGAVVGATLIAATTVTLVGCASTGGSSETAAAKPTVRYSLDAPQQWPGDLVVPLYGGQSYRQVDVTINGQAAGRYLLDTGANRPVIDTGRANHLGLPDVGGGTTTGIAGAKATRFRQAESIGLRADQDPVSPFLLETPGTRMIAMNMRQLAGPRGPQHAGIVCFRTLMSVPFTFNSQARTLTLHRPNDFRPPDVSDPSVTRVRLRRFHGLPVVDASLKDEDGQAVPIRLILDTGMNTAMSVPIGVLSKNPGVAAVPVSGAGISRGIGGSLTSTNTWARSTRVFDLELRNLPVAFEPMPDAIDSADGLPQGRLGMGVLAHFELTFDARRNWLYARYLRPLEAGSAENRGSTDEAVAAAR
ncbi:MAG: aspartyl protease family protein [Planctomycetota bacterium]